jgi:hypothetical protein
MSRQKKHPKRPGKQKSAVGQAYGAASAEGCAWRIRPIWEPNAAGMDIGARDIYVTAPICTP